MRHIRGNTVTCDVIFKYYFLQLNKTGASELYGIMCYLSTICLNKADEYRTADHCLFDPATAVRLMFSKYDFTDKIEK